MLKKLQSDIEKEEAKWRQRLEAKEAELEKALKNNQYIKEKDLLNEVSVRACISRQH